MNYAQKKLAFLCLSLTLILSVACSSDDDSSNDSTRLRIKAGASYTTDQSRNTASVSISEFKLNIKEIELEIDESSIIELEDDNGAIDSDDEIELQGPFELDLLSNTSNIVTVELPEAIYEEIEFEFDINTDASSDMFNRTVVMQGTINDTPFIFWHDFEEEVEVDFDDGFADITISEGLNSVVINFDLDTILSEVDLTTATDGDANGTIEISPVDQDGNTALAELLKTKLKDVTELLDD